MLPAAESPRRAGGPTPPPLRAAVSAPRLLGAGAPAPSLLDDGAEGPAMSSAALLLNLEGLATMAIAWMVFRENVDRRLLLGAAAILAGTDAEIRRALHAFRSEQTATVLGAKLP